MTVKLGFVGFRRRGMMGEVWGASPGVPSNSGRHHPVRHQAVHHARVCQGRSAALTPDLAFGDLAQDAAHDLAGAGLGQPRGAIIVTAIAPPPNLHWFHG
jgi:hypothetical protein